MVPDDPASPVLTVSGLLKTFPSPAGRETALNGISFDLAPGSVTGLIGPDGAGKTTLMRLLAGLFIPDSGSIAVMGHDPASDPLSVQGPIGYMPQKFGLYEDLTVQENLDLYADLQGVAAADRPARYGELLHMTGLGPFTRRLAGNLSGGMKQKLGLACTLVHRPPLLLLDEPTVGVDPVSRRELWAILKQLVADEGSTLFVSTAYLDEAERCDKILILYNGEILGTGPPEMFRREVSGRSFRATSPGQSLRALEPQFYRLPGIVDSVLQGNTLRLVSESTAPPDPPPGAGQIQLEPVPARFEDAFMVRVLERASGIDRSRETPTLYDTAPRNGDREGETAISVHDLTKRFGAFIAVDRVTFSVRRGEVFGLLGANGAGKTTTFRMLAGLLPPDEGVLTLDGMDMRRSPAYARQRLGYMAQKFSLYTHLTVRQNLVFYSSAYGLSGVRQKERVQRVARAFDLESFFETQSGLLPQGFRQRLALAAALMHEPPILLLDEPTSGMDPLARREFWRVIDSLAVLGVTVMVTTHFMEEAEYCDRLVILDRGRILAVGNPAEIKARVAGPDLPNPTLEDAFVTLLSGAAAPAGSAR